MNIKFPNLKSLQYSNIMDDDSSLLLSFLETNTTVQRIQISANTFFDMSTADTKARIHCLTIVPSRGVNIIDLAIRLDEFKHSGFYDKLQVYICSRNNNHDSSANHMRNFGELVGLYLDGLHLTYDTRAVDPPTVFSDCVLRVSYHKIL